MPNLPSHAEGSGTRWREVGGVTDYERGREDAAKDMRDRVINLMLTKHDPELMSVTIPVGALHDALRDRGQS